VDAERGREVDKALLLSELIKIDLVSLSKYVNLSVRL
jgi:hypothetical protein